MNCLQLYLQQGSRFRHWFIQRRVNPLITSCRQLCVCEYVCTHSYITLYKYTYTHLHIYIVPVYVHAVTHTIAHTHTLPVLRTPWYVVPHLICMSSHIDSTCITVHTLYAPIHACMHLPADNACNAKCKIDTAVSGGS